MDKIFQSHVFRNSDNKICVELVWTHESSIQELNPMNESHILILDDNEFDNIVTSLCEFVEFEPEFGGHTNTHVLSA